MLSGHFDLIVLEVCERYSRLGGRVPTRALCIRISRDLLPAHCTKQTLHEIIDFAAQMHIALHLWISIGCTSAYACEPLGPGPGAELMRRLVKAAVPLCRHNIIVGGTASWESPSDSELWKCKEVEELVTRQKMQECFAFSPGDSENVMNLDVEGARPVTNAETKLTEQIKIVTTNDKLRI